jgi:hypothetical protein|tara:strand:- start:4777 stop:5268 length:492 start_codon:yes stop_codon:yes gene_type:complete
MNKSDIKQIIREEIQKVMDEDKFLYGALRGDSIDTDVKNLTFMTKTHPEHTSLENSYITTDVRFKKLEMDQKSITVAINLDSWKKEDFGGERVKISSYLEYYYTPGGLEQLTFTARPGEKQEDFFKAVDKKFHSSFISLMQRLKEAGTKEIESNMEEYRTIRN